MKSFVDSLPGVGGGMSLENSSSVDFSFVSHVSNMALAVSSPPSRRTPTAGELRVTDSTLMDAVA